MLAGHMMSTIFDTLNPSGSNSVTNAAVDADTGLHRMPSLRRQR